MPFWPMNTYTRPIFFNFFYVIQQVLQNFGSVEFKSIYFSLFLNPGRDAETSRKYEVVVVVV